MERVFGTATEDRRHVVRKSLVIVDGVTHKLLQYGHFLRDGDVENRASRAVIHVVARKIARHSAYGNYVVSEIHVVEREIVQTNVEALKVVACKHNTHTHTCASFVP